MRKSAALARYIDGNWIAIFSLYTNIDNTEFGSS